MTIFNDFPYTNFHEINLAWIIGQIKKLREDFGEKADELIAELVSAFFLQVSYSRNDEMINLAATDGSGFSPEFSGGMVSAFNVQGEGVMVKDPAANWFRYKGQNIVFFGDSWTVGGSASATAYRFTSRIATALQMTERNYGVGAAGFAIPGNLISDQVTAAASNMSEEIRGNVPLVVITGGVNDWRHRDDYNITRTGFLQAVRDTCAAAHAAFPNALIVVAFNSMQQGNTDTMLSWYAMAARAGQARNYPIKVLQHAPASVNANTQTFQGDNLHLTDTGHERYADYIVRGILGGGDDVFFYIGDFTPAAGVTASVDLHIFRRNEEFMFNQVIVDLEQAVNSNTLIGTIPSAWAPRDTMYWPAYFDNRLIGNLAITAAGNIYVNTLNTDISAQRFRVSPGYWFAGQK